MNAAFAPIFTLSAIGTVMFLAGILNVMKIAVVVILFGGLFLFVSARPWKKDFFINSKDSFLVFAVFSGICLLFFIRLYGQIPTHYDCFSHWLTVIKDILINDRLPNFRSELIQFQSYPTGSAGFVYFILKVVGNTRDDIALFAQSLLYAACICSFFAFVKRKKDIATCFIAVVLGLFCLVANSGANTPIVDFLVDSLVSMFGVASIAIIIFYRSDITRAVWTVLPLSMFSVALKSIGVLTVVMNIALIMLMIFINDRRSINKCSIISSLRLGAISAGVPALLFYLWNRHVDLCFAAGNISKHAVSIGKYKQNLDSKTPEQIKEILAVLLERIFTPSNTLWIILIVFLTLFVGFLLKRAALKIKSFTELLLMPLMLVVYAVCMAAIVVMYIVSMPYGEAITLDSYSRYENTLVVYMVGMSAVYAMDLCSKLECGAKGGIVKSVLALITASTLLFQTGNLCKLFVKTESYKDSGRYRLEQLIDRYDIEKGKSYFIYGTRYDGDAGYHYYLSRYLFWTNELNMCSPDELESQKEKLKDYDYLIILDEDTVIKEYLSSLGLSHDEKVYSVSDIFK